MFNQKKYDKVKFSKEKLHAYAKEISHTGVLGLFKPNVTVSYFYIKGIPLIHEVRKNERFDNSLWQYGRTSESYDILRLEKCHLDFLRAEDFHNDREYNLTLKFIELRDRIHRLKYLRLRKMLDRSYMCVVTKQKKSYNRNDILKECDKLENKQK